MQDCCFQCLHFSAMMDAGAEVYESSQRNVFFGNHGSNLLNELNM